MHVIQHMEAADLKFRTAISEAQLFDLESHYRIEERLRGGTPKYMAPEQFTGEWRDFGPWTDLYALGCLAWALVTGSPPFVHDSVAAMCTAHLVRDPGDFVPKMPVPSGLEAWIRVLLSKEPGRRFRCAADAAFALRGLEGNVVAPEPGDSVLPVATRSRTLTFEDAALLLTMLVAAALIESFLRQSTLSTNQRLTFAAGTAVFWTVYIGWGVVRERAEGRGEASGEGEAGM